MGSIVINSSGDYITQSVAVTTPESFAIGGWWYRSTQTTIADGELASIASLYEYTGDSYNIAIARLHDLGTNIRAFASGGTGAFSPAASTTLIPDNAWYYIGISGSTGAQTYYIFNDNAGSPNLLCSASRAVTPSGSGKVGIGCRGNYNDAHQLGKYAYWKVWTTPLSQGDFEAQMYDPDWAVGTSNKHSGFNDSDTDTSGNSRTWTFNGTSTDSDTPPVIFPPTGLYPDAMTRRYQHLLIR